MAIAASSIAALPNRILRRSKSDSGAQYYRAEFISPPGFDAGEDSATHRALYEQLKDAFETPHAFLIDDQTGGPIPSHFHRVAQFQVIAKGDGLLGRRPVRSVSLHYTDPYTGYGPITPGPRGLSYFTLRSQFDPGANYLDQPGVRELLQPSRKRHVLVHADRINASTIEALAKRSAPGLDALIDEDDDGLAAYLLRLGPGMSAEGPVTARCGGQYCLVLAGDLSYAGALLPSLSCLFVSSSERSVQIQAGSSGAEVMILNFPRSRSSASEGPGETSGDRPGPGLGV